MRPKQLLLRGAVGVLLATGTAGVGVVAAAAPASATILDCNSLQADYDDYIKNAEFWYSQGQWSVLHNEPAWAVYDFGQADHFYVLARNVQLC